MNGLDELSDAMERYGDRGVPRGADDVWREATDPSAATEPTSHLHRSVAPTGTVRHRTILAAVVIVLLLAGGLWLLRIDRREVGVATTPPDPTTAVSTPPPLPSRLTAPGFVDRVDVAFGSVWIGTREPIDHPPGRSTLRSFAVGSASSATDTALVGDPLAMASGRHHLWVRTTSEGPAAFEVGGQVGNNGMYRVDPSTGGAVLTAVGDVDGPLTADATGDRIAYADATHVTIADDDGNVLASPTIDDVFGEVNATPAGTNGIVALRFSGDRLYALHQGRSEIVELDPTTGRRLARQPLPAGVDHAGLEVAGGKIWTVSEGPAAAVIGYPLPLGGRSDLQPVTLPSLTQGSDLEGTYHDQLIVRSATMISTIDPVRLRNGNGAHLQVGSTGTAFAYGDRLWMATWSSGDLGQPTDVTFTLLTDIPTAPAGTTPPPLEFSTSRPDGWSVAPHSYTPHMVDPVEVLAAGSYAMPDGPTSDSACDAQVPKAPLDALPADGVFVWIVTSPMAATGTLPPGLSDIGPLPTFPALPAPFAVASMPTIECDGHQGRFAWYRLGSDIVGIYVFAGPSASPARLDEAARIVAQLHRG